MKYIDIYSFQVIRELEKGNTVYILDKFTNEIFNAATIRAIDLLSVIKTAEENKNDRFYFWKEETEKGGAE